jgi:hypothetical protein
MPDDDTAAVLATLTPQQRIAVYTWLQGVDYDHTLTSYLWRDAFMEDSNA